MKAIDDLLNRIFLTRTPATLITMDTNDAETPQMHIGALPNDMAKVDLTAEIDKLATKLQPWRRTGHAKLSDLDSLILWANRNKGAMSALFADVGEKPKLSCIADYLGAGAPVTDHKSRDPLASHMNHRASYEFPLSQEWKTWNDISDTPLTGPELGEFVEANAKDLLEPTPALLAHNRDEANSDWEQDMLGIARQLQGRFGQFGTLTQLARNFQVNEVSNITASMNRDTGESSIQFLNEHQQADGAAVQIPNLFMVAIPVFDNGAAYRLPLRFRYRKAGATVKFIFTLHNAELAFRNALDEALARAKRETDLPLFRGHPETSAT